jgi:hypothetical protein
MDIAAPPQLHDELNWKTFVQFATVDLGAPQLKNQGLTAVWHNYDANIERMRLMLAVPAITGEIRSLITNCFDVAKFRITNNLDFTENWKSDEKEIEALWRVLASERVTEFNNKLNSLKTGDKNNDERVDKEAMNLIFSTEALITSFVQADKKLRVGMEHFIETSITSAWTAFEAMAADLWEAALNIHPRGLASLNAPLRHHPKSKPRKERDKGYDSDQNENIQKRGEDKTIFLRKLHDNDYDVRHKMGSILKYKYSFNTLWGIRKAYLEAFGEDSTDVYNAIMHTTFDQLSALRNVIVHNACICDADYMRDQIDIGDLPKAEKGFKVNINGSYANALLVVNQFYCKRLIQCVDNWISDN